MSSKRQSILPAVDRSGPKPPVNFSTSLTISDNAVLLGIHSITMQAETVVHPRSRVESSVGSVLVGRRCIIQERVHVGAPPDNRDKGTGGGVSLGDYVLIEAGSVIEAGGTEIGEGSVIQVGSKIGSGAKIGKNCTVSHLSVIANGDVLPDNTVVYSNGTRRTDKRGTPELRKLSIVKQIAMLRKMIPSNPDKFR
ncbi:trimeric LpxA-like protein [Trichoderma ceciliae]